MAKITFDDLVVELTPEQSVLDGLLAAGQKIPNSCRAGICQACKMQLVSGQLNPQSQQGLPEIQARNGLFLACCCHPKDDLEVALLDTSRISKEAEIIGHKMLSKDVLCLRLKTDEKWQAGQVINCIKDDTVIRSYSIASSPSEGFMELHIRVYPEGRFGNWAKEFLSIGDFLHIEAPFGECVYEPSSYDQPLLMVSTGTGLAPIYGVIKDALNNHHQGSIDLYLAAGEASHFYHQQELEALASSHAQLTIHKVVRRLEPSANNPDTLIQGDVVDVVLDRHKQLKGHRVYLCGAPEMVSQLKKASFMRGAKMQDILCDSFEAAKE